MSSAHRENNRKPPPPTGAAPNALKTFFSYVLFGQGLYLRWLSDSDAEIAKAQRDEAARPLGYEIHPRR